MASLFFSQAAEDLRRNQVLQHIVHAGAAGDRRGILCEKLSDLRGDQGVVDTVGDMTDRGIGGGIYCPECRDRGNHFFSLDIQRSTRRHVSGNTLHRHLCRVGGQQLGPRYKAETTQEPRQVIRVGSFYS